MGWNAGFYSDNDSKSDIGIYRIYIEIWSILFVFLLIVVTPDIYRPITFFIPNFRKVRDDNVAVIIDIYERT